MRSLLLALAALLVVGPALRALSRADEEATEDERAEAAAGAWAEGIVLCAGRPMEGAQLLLASEEVRSLEERLDPSPWQRPFRGGVTDGEGRFRVPVVRAGRYRLSAVHAPQGSGAIGPLELDGVTSARGLVLTLDRPLGAIEGIVHLPPDVALDSIGVRFDGPGGDRFQVAPDSDGRFAARDLVEGTWSLAVRPAQPRPERDPVWGRRSVGSHDLDLPPAWMRGDAAQLVRLDAGEHAALVLDLVAPSPCRLEGVLTIDGAPPALLAEGRIRPGWQPSRHAYLEPEEELEPAVRAHVASAVVDDAGRFSLGVREPGTYVLRLRLPFEGEGWELCERVEVRAGVTSWSLALGTGALIVTQPDGVTELRTGALSWLARTPRGGCVRVRPARPARADGGEPFARVPEGEGELVLVGREPVARANVVAGSTTRLALAARLGR